LPDSSPASLDRGSRISEIDSGIADSWAVARPDRSRTPEGPMQGAYPIYVAAWSFTLGLIRS
jgi:hypothetical protein